jgi:signal transduction histidine kinase
MSGGSGGNEQMAPDEVLRIAAEVTSSLDLTESLNAACRAVVRLLGCDHSGMAIFDQGFSYGVVRGEYPANIRAIGSRIQIEGVPFEERLISSRQPLFIADVRTAENLGPVRDLLLRMEIWSLLLVPVLIGDRIVGSFSIDFIRRQTTFSEADQRVCTALARLAAVAMENASTFHTVELDGTRASNDARLMDTLEEHSSHLTAQKEPAKLLQETVRLATEMFPGILGHAFQRHQDTGNYRLAFVTGVPFPPQPVWLSHSDPLLSEVFSSSKSKARLFPPDTAWSGAFVSFIVPGHVLCTPLKVGDTVESLLFLQDPVGLSLSQDRNLEVLRRFFARAESALELARLVSPDQRASARIAVFEVITGYILRARDPERIYNAFLTGVTADYGLGLNCAALFLFDKVGDRLTGACAIGEVAPEAATAAWKSFHREAKDFTSFASQLELGTASGSTLATTIRGCTLELSDPRARPLFTAANARVCIVIPADRLGELPEPLVQGFRPSSPLLVAPVVAQNRVLGMVLADNRFTQAPITDEDKQLLMSLSKTTALALDNLNEYSEMRTDQERLRKLSEASNRLRISSNVRDVGENIAQEAVAATGAAGVGVMIINENGQCKVRYIAGREEHFNPDVVLRPSGLSMQVFRSGKPLAIGDTATQIGVLNPRTFRPHNRAAICLSMVAQGRSIGVMWLQYAATRSFSASEISSLQYFANQAAITYRSAVMLYDIDCQLMAGSRSPETVREAYELVVEQARVMFSATAATLTPYDVRRARFIPDELAGAGLDQEYLQSHLPGNPASDDITWRALADEYVEVFEPTSAPGGCGADAKRGAISGVGTRQAITLRADNEPVGVLQLIYDGRPAFSPNRERLHAFAKHVGTLLRNLRLQHHLVTARRAGQRAARLAATGRYDATLREIAIGALMTLSCDAVVLYGYNPETKEFIYPPTCRGLRDTASTRRFHSLPPDSWVRKFLALERNLPIPDVDQDSRFHGRPFASREGVKSLVLVPLRFAATAVGLMFVNYRYFHRMTDYELEDVQLFADHAAVAIRTALYIEEHALLSRELKERYEDLQEVDRKKTEYLATISHELRTPLAPLVSIIDALLDETYGFVSAKQREKLSQALERAHEEARLIDNLVDLVRIQSGKTQLDLHTMSLAQMLQTVMSIFEHSAGKKGVTLTLELPPGDALECVVDKTKIMQVVTNLVGNAIKFTGAGGSVTVSVEREASHFVVSVVDTGEGVEEGDLARIFERFQQAGRSPERSRGLGVGLNIVRDWVQLHGGEVHVRSKAGEGSTFWFTLPRRRPRADREPR